MGVKGYKGFDKNLQCIGFQYTVGETYQTTKSISLCNNGFHFCERIFDVHSYYNLGLSRVCEVEALGEVIKDKNKSVTNKIKIIRELSVEEIKALANTGANNIGFLNIGDLNSGNLNSGNRNIGDLNSGDRNSGDLNSGNRNSGNRNSGDRNSGDFNSCDNSSGLFMSKRISYEAFNKSLTKSEFNAFVSSEGFRICQQFQLLKYSIKRPGKLRTFKYADYKTSWRYYWNSLTFGKRVAIRRMPHFDKDVFFEITGVKA
jgi:hypothetical protein